MAAWGAWGLSRLSVTTLGFGSGHDLTVHEFEPHVRLCAAHAEPAWDSLSPSHSAPPLHWLSLSLSLKNKHFLKFFLKDARNSTLRKPVV